MANQAPHTVAYTAERRNIRQLAHDLDRIEGKYQRIVFCVTETDLKHFTYIVQLMIAMILGRGIEVWLNGWAFGRIFGGEALSEFGPHNPGCLCNPVFRSKLVELLDLAAGAHATGIFWDEPDLRKSGCPVCSATPGKTLEFLEWATEQAYQRGLRNMCCLEAKEENIPLFYQVATLIHVEEIGTDPYFNRVEQRQFSTQRPERWAAFIKEVAETCGVCFHVWVQSFDIEGGYERLLGHIIGAIAKYTDAISVWAIDGCEAINNRSDRPEVVMQVIEESLALLRIPASERTPLQAVA